MTTANLPLTRIERFFCVNPNLLCLTIDACWLNREDDMKTQPQTLRRLAIVFATVSALAISAVAHNRSGKVTFEPYGIVIHPMTKLSKSHEQALNDILKKYPTRLYRIETYENGKLTKTQGQLRNRYLEDIYIDRQVLSEIANARAAGQSKSAACFVGSDKNAPKHLEVNKELLQELKPILAKYSR